MTTLWLRFEDSGNIMKDTVTGNSVGHLNGSGWSSSTNVAGPTIPLTGGSNNRSLSLSTSSWASITQSAFAFHSGQTADATLEFSFKAPLTNNEQSIFWTRSSDSDLNRYNIFRNRSGSDGRIFGDYRAPNGSLHYAASQYHHYDPTDWTHVAIVRSAVGSQHRYEWYFNGVQDTGLTRMDANPALPTQSTWSIGGRGGHRYGGLIDEVRTSNTALSPDEFMYRTVPEPASVVSLGVGLCLMGVVARRRVGAGRS